MLPLPLYLLRVLDLGRSTAGAFAGRSLADLGTEVIRVEPSAAPPPPDAAAFSSLHRDKFSLALDLATPAGRDLCLRLAAAVDILLLDADTASPAPDALRRAQPQAILISIAADAAAETGVAAAAAVLTALFHHRATGEGLRIDIDGPTVQASLAVAPAPPSPALDALAADPHLRDGGFFEDVAQPGSGVAPLDGVPYRFSRTPAHVRLPAPPPGRHTRYVLRELLHLDDAAIEALHAAAVVSSA